jgi:hypothetical protein
MALQLLIVRASLARELGKYQILREQGSLLQVAGRVASCKNVWREITNGR